MSATDTRSILSDESSFYGDEEEVSRLEELASTYDPEPYWKSIHPYLLSTIQYDVTHPPQPKAEEKAPPERTSLSPTTTLNINPEAPITFSSRNAPSTNESIPNFLSRLPPSTTQKSDIGPWIFAWSPSHQSTKRENIGTLVSKGHKLLHAYEDQKSDLEAQHDRSGAKTRAPLTRKLNPLRQTLEKEIFALARETNVISGKWMLFPTPDRVDEYWGLVAEATARGDLGIAAKVATDEGKESARLLAVYTRDFEDKEDVRRVLEGVVELGLVKEGQRPIYYKCDAYTYLEITAGNPYGLKASLFSSRDVLKGSE